MSMSNKKIGWDGLVEMFIIGDVEADLFQAIQFDKDVYKVFHILKFLLYKFL